MNRDELAGKGEALKGRMKEAAGDLMDNDRMRDEGAADEAAGEARDDVGRARRKLGEKVEDIGEKIKR